MRSRRVALVSSNGKTPLEQACHRRLLGSGAATALLLAVGVTVVAQEQRRPLQPPVASQPESPQHRMRLILKDGSYQTVLSYRVVGDRVRYRSAERNGEEEDLPLSLVDLPATTAWQRAHDPAVIGAGSDQAAPALSPELAREEADRAARMPEVAQDLRLPEDDSILVLDAFHGTPELIPLPQYGSDLNRETAHAVQKKGINPLASPHDLLLLKDERADVQLHVAEPVFYLRLDRGKGDDEDGQAGFVVDTQGQAGRTVPVGGSSGSEYVLEHLDVREGARAVASVRLQLLGSGKRQPDVIEVRADTLPGGYWKKLVPVEPLEFGEYALLEILDGRTINADVWDFGVHPTAKENDEALRPEPKRPAQLERRRGHTQ